jgi:hypothetical protein
LGIIKQKIVKADYGFANIGRFTIVLKSSWNTSDMKDSMNGKEPIGAPRIRKLDSSVRILGRSDINSSTHSLIALKALMFQTFLIIIKKKSNTFKT